MGVGFILILIASSILVALFSIYCWIKLDGRKFDLINKNILVAWLILSTSNSLINLFVPKVIKIFTVVAMLMLVNYFLLTKRLDKSIASIIVYEMLSMVCELFLKNY